MTQVEKPAQNSGWLRFLPDFVIQRLSGRHNLQAILGNSAWQVADKIVRMGVARTRRPLGSALPGASSLWATELCRGVEFRSSGAIANLGLDSIVIREFVKFPERRDAF